jgi:hypothetical protein
MEGWTIEIARSLPLAGISNHALAWTGSEFGVVWSQMAEVPETRLSFFDPQALDKHYSVLI